jgi:hypothetical protein
MLSPYKAPMMRGTIFRRLVISALSLVEGGGGPTGVGEMYLPFRATAHLPIDSCHRK